MHVWVQVSLKSFELSEIHNAYYFHIIFARRFRVRSFSSTVDGGGRIERIKHLACTKAEIDCLTLNIGGVNHWKGSENGKG